jgi:signal transduction histidine kinase
VRVRTTTLAVVVVATALMLGAIGLVLSLRHSLTEEIRRSAQLRADDVAAALESGTPISSLALAGDDESFVQILGPTGAVEAASPNLATGAPVGEVAPGDSRRIDDVPITEQEAGSTTPEEEQQDFMVAARAAVGPDQSFLVLAGRSFDVVNDSAAALTGVLMIGVPILLLVLGGASWVLIGRALAPVEAMRREVDEITSSALDRRVPEPTGTDEISRLAITLNSMLERLERAQLRQRRFVSDASHELRSPVAAIRQHAEVAVAHPESTPVDELAGEIVDETERLQRLVDDLLLVARADEHTLAVEQREVDLDDLVLEEARRLREITPLRIDTSGVSAGRVVGDAALLSRALRNLADNASRHASNVIALSVAEDDGVVRLTVDDDGPGIPPTERLNVFERFVRLDDARARDTGGSGLGLSIVAEVASVHGGVVTATASPQGGARVEMAFPAAV